MSESISKYFFMIVFLLVLPFNLKSSTLSWDESVSGNDEVTVIISLKQSGKAYNRALPNNIFYRGQKISQLMNSNEKAYRNVIRFANKFKEDERMLEITPVWIANSLVVRAKRSLLSKLAQNETVETMHISRTIRIIDPVEDVDESLDSDSAYTYGLKNMGIPKLTKEYPLALGTGIRVGHIDTGVNPEHPDLKGKVIAFKDFINGRSEAYDDNDHGTHTAGTIAGWNESGTRIGVAPEVRLIVAKVFDKNGSGDEANLLKAMQWIADPDGNPETLDGPVVVSNSWGGSAGTVEEEKPFSQAVKNWVALGIFPCFAAGNSGPYAYTVNTPGGYAHSFAVGASDENDTVASFSSRGPFKYRGDEGEIRKPDVSAPGSRVYSALANGKWGMLSGTSMATPHVAGLVALIFQVQPKITTEEIGRILTETAMDIDIQGYDFNTGWGRVDAYRSFKMAMGVKEEKYPEYHYDELAFY